MNRVDESASRRVGNASAITVLVALSAVPSPGPWTAAAVATCAVTVGLGPDPVRRVATAWLLGALGLTAVLLGWGGAWADVPRDLLYSSLRMGVPWLAGFAWRLRTQVRAQAVDDIAAARQRKHDAVERDRARERLGLAESLHDDLGHSLSLVALDLGRLELDSTLTPSAQESVGTARRQLARAVERLGDSVESLRVGSAPGLPRHDCVQSLIRRARESRVDVEVTNTIDMADLPDAAHTSLFRILQEAFTNASKYAPGSPITVQLSEREATLIVRVSNPTERTPILDRGTGIESLKAFLHECNGDLSVDTSKNTFVLDARIPRTCEIPRCIDVPPEAELAGLTRAQRRGRLLLAGAAALSVSILASVESITWFQASRTVLSEEDFQQLRVGDSRTYSTGVLPEHELPDGSGDCHFYAVTADRFADSSGNRYRICFDGDTVSDVRLVSE